MADILYSAFGQIVQRYEDMGVGGDGFQSWAKVMVPQGGVPSGSADSGNPIKVGGVYNSPPPILANGQRGNLQVGSRGSLHVELFGQDSAFGVGVITFTGDGQGTANVGLLTASTNYVFNGSALDRMVKPNSASRLLSSAATTNANSVKASAGNLQKIICNNTNAADRFLKFYNKASAPIVGTDTPILTLTLPASTKNIQIDTGAMGHYFSAGIAYAITANAADADATAIAAGDITALNITYS